MTDYLRRIDTLKAKAEQMAEAYRKQQRDKAPFCEILIDELLGDGKATIISHPQGIRGKSNRWSGTLKAAFEWIDQEGIAAYINMIYCPLWARVYFQQSALYTAAQKAMFLEMDKQKYPEVAKLYDYDEPDAFIDFLADIPQYLHFPAHNAERT